MKENQYDQKKNEVREDARALLNYKAPCIIALNSSISGKGVYASMEVGIYGPNAPS